MLRPDQSRGRRDDPPEAADLKAPALRAEALPGLAWNSAGRKAGVWHGGDPRRRQGGPGQMPKG